MTQILAATIVLVTGCNAWRYDEAAAKIKIRQNVGIGEESLFRGNRNAGKRLEQQEAVILAVLYAKLSVLIVGENIVIAYARADNRRVAIFLGQSRARIDTGKKKTGEIMGRAFGWGRSSTVCG